MYFMLLVVFIILGELFGDMYFLFVLVFYFVIVRNFFEEKLFLINRGMDF